MTISADQEDLDLNLLRTFLAVAQCGSMGKAASMVARTQAAVSQQMARLEKIVGRKLFSRSRNGMHLTDHGELLVVYANRVIDLNQEALTGLREESARGTVRLGISEETLLVGLTRVLTRFRKSHPGIDLQLTVAQAGRMEFLQKQGEVDLVLSDLSLMAGDPVFEWRSQLVWLASVDLSVDPFKTLPLVLCGNMGLWRENILSSLQHTAWDWRLVFESASLDATLAVVESGLGVSVLPSDTPRNIGIREVEHAGLPRLPEARFGMFRGQTDASPARDLMEATLSSSFRSVTTRIDNRPAWRPSVDNLLISDHLQEMGWS
jgi:DNA-binding transcriptional LysR family regulator